MGHRCVADASSVIREAAMKRCVARLSLAAMLFAGPAGVPFGTVAASQPGGALDGPRVLDVGGQQIRVVPITGLVRPWALAILPNGDILVTERPGRLRIIRDGVLDPQPISGLPEVNTGAVLSGLMDIVLHPQYAENQLVYFTYSKPMPGNPHEDFQGERDAATCTLARARFDGGSALTDVRDIFVADAWAQGTSGSRIAFSRDGKIIMTVRDADASQDRDGR